MLLDAFEASGFHRRCVRNPFDEATGVAVISGISRKRRRCWCLLCEREGGVRRARVLNGEGECAANYLPMGSTQAFTIPCS